MSSPDKNPFSLPPAEESFRVRERQRAENEQRRRDALDRPIFEKTSYTSTMSSARRAIAQLTPDIDPSAMRRARQANGLVVAATAALSNDRRRDKESVSTFIAKKREMFMLQMSIDMKKAEIVALEQDAAKAEETLRRNEEMLELDAARFDAFLKESDAQAHEALRRAEAQSRIKTEKAHELKKLQHTQGALASEKTRLREVLEEYRGYKEFLDALTPPEWHEEVRSRRDAAVAARRADAWHGKLAEWEQSRAVLEAEVTEQVESERRAAQRVGRVPPRVDVAALVAASLPPAPTLDSEPLPALLPDEADDCLPMYFTEPEQLLGLFTALEESNLFLISNCQDTEQALDELRLAQEEAKAAMSSQSATLEAGMTALREEEGDGRARMAELVARSADTSSAVSTTAQRGTSQHSSLSGSGAGVTSALLDGALSNIAEVTSLAGLSAAENVLPELRAGIAQVYARCGFAATATSDTISMLTALEGRLESLLAALSTMDKEFVATREKEKERERRVRVREARLAAQRDAHEVRQRKILERALQPSAKRTGKPAMTRSLPFPKKEREVRPSSAQRRAEADAVYLS